MTKNRKETTNHSGKGSGGGKKVPEKGAAADTSGSCRCKEVAKKTPREMLSLMISDLAFWKKQKDNHLKKSD